MFILFLVLRCPSLPVVAHAQPDSDNVDYMTVIVYTCDHGYSFVDGLFEKAVECSWPQWNDSLSDCYGEIKNINLWITVAPC